MRHRKLGRIFYLFLFLLVLPLLFVVSMPSSSFAVHDAPGAFAEDPAINGCNHCHNMTITAGNADGSNRLAAYSPLNVPGERDPHTKRNSWGGTVTIMNGKEATPFTSVTTAYLNAWYCTTCSCPSGIAQGQSCNELPGPFTLTITRTGSGTGTVTAPVGTNDGINCGTNCSEAYNSGTMVTMTATPDVGSVFGGWTGNSDCSDGQVTMNADKTCTAIFNVPDTQAPTIPQNVQGTPDPNQCKITLTWDPSTDNVGVTGYNVYRDLGTSPVGVSSLTTFTDTGLAQGTMYTYEVTAFDGATPVPNESGRSTAIQVTTTSGCTNVPIVMFRMSVDNTGNQGNSGSDWASISGDGYRIAFHSDSNNLVPNDTNGLLDIFVRDRVANTTTRVSVDSSGTQGNGHSGHPSISRDGRYVAFWSLATNLVSGDTNTVDDIFVHDMVTGATERISVSSSGTQGNGPSYPVTPLSADGRYVAFASAASNLVANDTNNQIDIFVRDRQTGTTERVSVDSSGLQANGYSGNPSINADGRYVMFQSTATNLIGGDTNVVQDVFVHDRQTGETLRVSVGPGGTQANDTSQSSTRNGISADGQLIGFSSLATNLVSGDTNGVQDAFVYNRVTNTVERVSVDSNGVQGNGFSMLTSLSSDGHFVGFNSQATNLVNNDTNGVQDVFVHNRLTHKTERVSVDSSGIEGNNISYRADLSSDGRYAAFSSDADNLVLGDTNGVRDVFVRDRGASTLRNISTRAYVLTGNNIAIGGFRISGTEPKTVLIRGRGPSMGGPPFNLPGVLPDPMITLYFGSNPIAQNDNWQTTEPQCDSPAISCGGASQITATGKDPCQPFPGQSSPPQGCTLESAILVTLPPGLYTVFIQGVNNVTGIGLIEVFEADTNTTMSNLVNISTRAFVGTGDNVAIGGFVVQGDNLRKVLIRGRGPSLGGPPFNLPGVLADPFLRLYHGSTAIAENNDWQTSLALCSQSGYECGGASEITATGKDPCQPFPGQSSPPQGCTMESAIIITLPPGLYTAILSGVNLGTGLGIVEVFDVP